MKTIKLLLMLVVTSTIFYSCSDTDPIENQGSTQSSIALRTTLAEIKKANGIAGRSATDAIFCFEFVYPITFSFNNGTNVTVNSFEGLLDILSNESPQLYLNGVVFPFEVVQLTGTVSVNSTINSEEDFVALLESCGFDTIDDDLQNTFCFDIVFPIVVTSTTGGNIAIETMDAFELFMDSPSSGFETQIVFPIAALYNGEVVEIDNIYEFYQMVGNCDACVCTLEYEPVCVQTANGIIEFGNSCFAICSGYSQNDFINCDEPTNCSITNLTAVPGECNTDGTYALTLNFTYANSPNAQFEVRNNSSDLLGTFDLADLPVTITHYPNPGLAADFVYITIVGDPTCTATQQWSVACGDTCEDACPTNSDPVCVMTTLGPQQFSNECFAICAGFTSADFITCGVASNSFAENLGSCFTINYPVQIEHQGALVAVDTDSAVLQYYFPAFSSIPAFHYPITAVFNGVPITIATHAEFENFMQNACN